MGKGERKKKKKNRICYGPYYLVVLGSRAQGGSQINFSFNHPFPLLSSFFFFSFFSPGPDPSKKAERGGVVEWMEGGGEGVVVGLECGEKKKFYRLEGGKLVKVELEEEEGAVLVGGDSEGVLFWEGNLFLSLHLDSILLYFPSPIFPFPHYLTPPPSAISGDSDVIQEYVWKDFKNSAFSTFMYYFFFFFFIFFFFFL